MERSKFLELNLRDLFKGLVVTIITSVLTSIITICNGGNIFAHDSLIIILNTAIASICAYLLKNFITNSKGELLTKES